MSLPSSCRLVQNAPEAAGAGGEALEQAVEEAAAAWDEASNGERAPFEAQATGTLPPSVSLVACQEVVYGAGVVHSMTLAKVKARFTLLMATVRH